MVHALHLIHRLLKADGLLIDLHPTIDPASIGVRQGDRSTLVGWVHETDDYEEYQWADEALAAVVKTGLFTLEKCGTFDFTWHADGLPDLRAYLADEWQDAFIDEVTALRIEETLQTSGHDKEILVHEAINIARFRRI